MVEEDPTLRQLRDPRELRALAHPLRMSIVEQLTVHGPATATELSDLLDESPANCSWHLRKLAEHGFVEEAASGAGRRRPWQMASIGFTSGVDDMSHEEAQAQMALTEMWLDRQVDRHRAVRRATTFDNDDGFAREAVTTQETAVWVTEDEMTELKQDIWDLFQRHRDRIEDVTARPDGARLVELVLFTTPYDVPGENRRPAPDQD